MGFYDFSEPRDFLAQPLPRHRCPLATAGFSAVQRADLQKLSRGIDHRSRICGWSDGAGEASPDKGRNWPMLVHIYHLPSGYLT